MMQYNLSRLGRLIRKELSEILRDRRTIVTLVLMPVLLYPLLSVAFQQFFLASRLVPGQGIAYRLGFVAAEDLQRFADRIVLGDRVLLARQAPLHKKAQEADAVQPEVLTQLGTYEELAPELHAGRIDAIVRNAHPPVYVTVPPPAPLAGDRDQLLEFEIVFVPSSPGGQETLNYIEQRLAAANEFDLLRRLNRSDVRVPSQVVRLLKMPTEEAAAGSIISLASLVPLILILMTITGAVYPAIDLTAGERERGTLEILVAAPVPRLGLLFAKYVSVVAVAVLTALVNLIAMTLTLVLSGLGPLLFGSQGLSLGTIVQIFGLLLLFAAFFSAVLLCITSFARSFKEAQAYLIPLMLVSLAPGVMGMMPGLKLTDFLAVTPLLNIVLLGRDLFNQQAELGPALIVIGTTLAYALAAITLAARIFGAESVLYNEHSSWGDLFRRPAAPHAFASVSAALWCLALMIPVNFVLRGLALLFVQSGLLDERAGVVIGPIRTVLMFGALPALFAWRGRLTIASAFGVARARWPTCVGAIVLGASLWPLIFVGMEWLNINLADWQKTLYEQTVESLRRLGPAVKITIMVITGVLEEWFFRGYLYSALRQRAGAAATILVTALLFGVLHYVMLPEFGLVRVLPSAVMGLVLGMVRESSGSVLPGMLLHAFYNGFLSLLIQEGTDQLATVEPWWIGAGAAGTAIGAGLMWLGRGAEAFRRR